MFSNHGIFGAIGCEIGGWDACGDLGVQEKRRGTSFAVARSLDNGSTIAHGLLQPFHIRFQGASRCLYSVIWSCGLLILVVGCCMIFIETLSWIRWPCFPPHVTVLASSPSVRSAKLTPSIATAKSQYRLGAEVDLP